MKALIKFNFFIACVVITDGVDLLANEECEEDPQGYIVPDPIYCDRYMECDPGAVKSIKICKLSEKFDFEFGCYPEELVDCGERTKTWNVDHVATRIQISSPNLEETVTETEDESLDNLSSPFSSGNNPKLSTFGSFSGGITSPTRAPTTKTTAGPPPPSSVTDSSSRSRSSVSEVNVPNDPLKEIACEGLDEYVVPDPSHCDRFWSCPSEKIELCDEGFNLDLESGFCEPRSNVNCDDRPLNFRDNMKELEKRLAEKINALNSGFTSSQTVSEVGSGLLPESLDSNLLSEVGATPGSSQGHIIDAETIFATADLNTPSPSNRHSHLNLASTINDDREIALNSNTRSLSGGITSSSRITTKTSVPQVPHLTESIHSSSASRQNQRVSSDTNLLGSRNAGVSFAEEISSQILSNVRKNTQRGQNILNSESSSNERPRPAQDQRVQSTKNVLEKIRTTVISSDRGNSEARESTDDNVEQIKFSVDDLQCDLTTANYRIGDGEQCDKYAVCAHGTKTVLLCPDGKAFSLQTSRCDLLSKVDCGDRPKLQTPKSTTLCPRENGFFPFPAEHSCEKYIDCRNGVGRVLSCGAGAVFDEQLFCVHPDQTLRPGCSAQEKYQFTCPSSGLTQRFGDHDRLPHPTDCSFFYACLSNGAPRLLSCQKPTVFNPVTGFCEHQDKVPGCEGYYSLEEELSVEAREKLAQEIREQILKEFNLAKRK